MTAPAPTASGTLAETPFAHVLLTIARKSMSGTLVVLDEGLDDRLLFQSGHIAAVRLKNPATAIDEGVRPLYDAMGQFAFYEGVDLTGERGVVRGHVDAITLVAESTRVAARKSVVRDVIEKMGQDTRLQIRVDADSRPYRLKSDERAMWDKLAREPKTPRELVVESETTVDRACEILYMLIITFAIEPAVSSKRPSSAAARRASVRSLAPSALAALTRLRAMRDSKIPPEQRKPVSDEAPPIRVSSPVPAAPLTKQDDMRRLEGLMGRREWDDARVLIEDLLAVEPEDPDFHAAFAWVLFNTNTDQDADVNEMLLEINEALRYDERHDRALYYKGMILKRQGLYRRAIVCFIEAVEANRANIDAKREIHLAKKMGII